VTLVADSGDFNKTSGKVHLQDNVVITTSSGAKLTTDTLDWDRVNQLVSTPDKVNIEKENMFTTATGASGRPNLNTMVLEKDVTVKIHPDDKGKSGASKAGELPLVITCDGKLEVDYQNNIARFNDNVKADKDGSTIYCDVMEIHFSRKDAAAKDASLESAMMGSKVNKIIARGNVRVVKGENVSYSEVAEYNAADQKIVLTGKPRLVIYSAEDFKQGFGGS
jgi:lipopolysaccharide export system protein LptA